MLFVPYDLRPTTRARLDWVGQGQARARQKLRQGSRGASLGQFRQARHARQARQTGSAARLPLSRTLTSEPYSSVNTVN